MPIHLLIFHLCLYSISRIAHSASALNAGSVILMIRMIFGRFLLGTYNADQFHWLFS